jgi:hypothetical protein
MMSVLSALQRNLLPLLIIVAAAYLYRTTAAWDVPAPSGRLGPDVWPKAILIFLIATCAFAVLRSIVTRRSADAGTLEEIIRATQAVPAGADAGAAPSYPRLVLGGIVLFVLYTVALEHLGFVVTTVLFLVAFMYVGRWRNHAAIAATAVLGGLAFFVVFRGVVYVSLPLGRGPFLDFSLWLARLLGLH